jgi:hypothetical protein
MKFRLFATVFLATAMFGAMSLPSGASAPNAYALMKLVLADADAYNTVHFVSRSSFTGTSLLQVTDAGRTIGRQTNTLTVDGKSNTLVIELIDRILYVKGDATVLEKFLGLPNELSNQFANKWFVILPNHSGYAGVALGLTVSSAMSELTMTDSVTVQPSTSLSVVKVEVEKGVTAKIASQPTSSEVLYFSATKNPLPVEAIQTFKAAKGSLLFSKWNEMITLAQPNATLRLS